MEPVPFKPKLTPDFVVRSLHLKIPVLQRPHLAFSGISMDSRTVQPGSLFVALKGDTFDGHDFIDAAIAAGAKGVICQRGTKISTLKDVSCFAVEDPLTAFRKLAAAWRREFSIPLIVVAGSAGKTTTKEFIAAMCSGKWTHILKTQGSQNGFVGIPMTLLGLRAEHEVAIIEVGIDEIGAMKQHMTLIGANFSVLTSIGPEHLEQLFDVPTVAREEGIALSSVAKAGGTVAISLDDPWIRPHFSTLREGRKIPFSLLGAKAPVDMISGHYHSQNNELTFEGLGLQPTTVPLPLPGKHNAANLLAAVALGAGMGLTEQEISQGLKNFKGAEGRSQVTHLPGDTYVICDYYNAQPASMASGLELLTEVAKYTNSIKSRWACLGDMLELGKDEEFFHRELAPKIIELNLENILLFGPRMAFLADELANKGFQGRVEHFAHLDELTYALNRGVNPGDVILIKGSRGMKMEYVWNQLKAHTQTHWSSGESENTIPQP